MNLINKLQDLMDATGAVDWLGPLALRLYLVPVFWVAGMNKVNGFENTVAWFGNSLGMPFPTLMASLATGTEVLGAVLLLLGLGVRWICIPLLITMFVAGYSAHWDNGWQTIADARAPFPPPDIEGAMERLGRARSILREHGNYAWLTETGRFVVLNNGIQFAATYFVMLLALFFTGAGRIVSVDYWIAKKFRKESA